VINTKRYIQLLLLQFLCWGFVIGSPNVLAADADGSTAPVITGSTVGSSDSTITNMPTTSVPDGTHAAPGVSNDVPDSKNLPASTVTNGSISFPRSKSQNVTINLINRLVERGVLSAEDAKELIQQAEKDAAEARAQASTTATDQTTNDTVHVPYVPEIVRVQIRDEIEDDVMKQARLEHWVAPNTLPPWVSQMVVKGDIRFRYEEFLFPKGNNTTGVFPNFNAINTGAPFDTTGSEFSPQRDVDHDRTQIRLRARLGSEIDLGNGFTAGLRLASGSDDQPVSQNQSLGAANGAQGGDFSKYAIWLDQAFIKYELGGSPTNDLTISVGRFDNPFFSTSIIWYDNLDFDGVAVQGRREVARGVTPFFAGGAFPVFNTDFNFSSDRPDKYPSEDKWLYAGQSGVDWKINDDFSFKGAGAFYDFIGVQGKISKPFVPLTAQDQGNTDDTRPSFAQFGNTYMTLRDITPTAANDFGTINQWQYFGLATSFRDIAFTGKLDYHHFEPFTVSLNGEYVRNIAFDRSSVSANAVNNRAVDSSGGALGPFVGGDTAWIGGINLGSAALQKFGDWDITLNYRYVESDAVIDGFCEPDFGGGGTNVKGYTIRGWFALAPRIFLGLNWMSSDQVAGPTLKADTFWVDANAVF
jgi:hypothetical protein